ncbi:hypothetical protein BGZ57DRAFT_901747 [Hyaloscypha finlandica]|nr:hypothetical protein BGZ57DRAFT_901747 [Hyaloscypha finlandica]
MARIRYVFSKRQQQLVRVPQRITARVAIPIYPERPSIAQLPDEALRLILSYVDDIDLRTLATINSTLYEKARYVQHHTVAIDLGQHRHALSLLDILERNRLQPAVRVIELSGGSYTQEDDDILVRLADLMSAMTGLRDLHWSCLGTFPHILRDRIPAQTRLHVSITGRGGTDDQVRERFMALVGNQNLFSLSVHLGLQIEFVCSEKMRALKEVLLSCPRLTRIPLLYVGPIITPPHGMGEGPSFGAPYCGLGFSGGEKPLALEELGVTMYPWGREPTPHLVSIKAVYCAGYPEKGSEVDYWAEKFNWTQLRKLNDIPKVLAPKIAPKLTHLKEVVLEEEYWDKSEFLEGIPTVLEVLSIPSWGHISNQPSPIIRHGAALRKLTIHRQESEHNPRIFLADTDLVVLCQSLPYLTELILDIARDTKKNAWPYSSLDIIAKFPSLKVVELWFELSNGWAASPTPHLTVSAARELFNYLHQRSSNIQSLKLRSGIPGRGPPIFGDPSWGPSIFGGPSWELQNSVYFLCKVSICDGDAADGYVIVTCPQLSTEMNAELTRLSKLSSKERGPANNATELSIKVALEGPLTMEDLKAWGRLQDLHAYKAYRKENSVPQRLGRFVSNALRWK